jgi:hypothetical protein
VGLGFSKLEKMEKLGEEGFKFRLDGSLPEDLRSFVSEIFGKKTFF